MSLFICRGLVASFAMQSFFNEKKGRIKKEKKVQKKGGRG
jgi:hypothetical protein